MYISAATQLIVSPPSSHPDFVSTRSPFTLCCYLSREKVTVPYCFVGRGRRGVAGADFATCGVSALCRCCINTAESHPVTDAAAKAALPPRPAAAFPCPRQACRSRAVCGHARLPRFLVLPPSHPLCMVFSRMNGGLPHLGFLILAEPLLCNSRSQTAHLAAPHASLLQARLSCFYLRVQEGTVLSATCAQTWKRTHCSDSAP